MTYEEAMKILETFTAGIQNDEDDWQPAPEDILDAMATRNRLEAIRPAWAFATVWRHDIDDADFELPPIRLVGMVEYLIGEPVWDRLYYDSDGNPLPR